MKLKPLFDRIVLAPKKTEETKGGILLPSVAQDKSQIAKVVAVGEGNTPDGKEVKMLIKVGDEVLYSKYAGVEIQENGEMFVIVRQADVLAVIE